MLDGKNIVLIGGTRGIGLSAAEAIIGAGGKVVAVGLDDQSCEEAKEKLGTKGHVIRADACTENAAPDAIVACCENFGPVDGVFHIAGGSGRRWGDGPLHECSLEGWNKTMELNLNSMMLSNRAAIRYWLSEGIAGSLLNLGSVLGYAPSPAHFATHAYATAKSAAIGLTKALAAHYAPDNIRVNLLVPAMTRTPMAQRALNDAEIMDYVKEKQPLDGGRAGLPADLDGAALYFLSDHSRFTTGQVLAVDGGWGLREAGSKISSSHN